MEGDGFAAVQPSIVRNRKLVALLFEIIEATCPLNFGLSCICGTESVVRPYCTTLQQYNVLLGKVK